MIGAEIGASVVVASIVVLAIGMYVWSLRKKRSLDARELSKLNQELSQLRDEKQRLGQENDDLRRQIGYQGEA